MKSAEDKEILEDDSFSHSERFDHVNIPLAIADHSAIHNLPGYPIETSMVIPDECM